MTTVLPQNRSLGAMPVRMAIDANGFLVPVIDKGGSEGAFNHEERLLKKAEASHLLNVSMATINRMLKAGKLPRRQVNGSVRIPLSAVKEIMGG